MSPKRIGIYGCCMSYMSIYLIDTYFKYIFIYIDISIYEQDTIYIYTPISLGDTGTKVTMVDGR